MEKIEQNKIVLANIISTVVIQGINFFSIPIFSRIMGPNNYGVVSIFLVWSNVIGTIFSLQAGGGLAIAKANFPDEEQKLYQSSVLFLASIAFSVGFILVSAISFVFQESENVSISWISFAFLYAWGSFCINFFNSKLSYEFQAGKNAVIAILLAISTTILSFLLINYFPSNINYYGRIISLVGIYTISGIIISIYIFSKGKVYYSRRYWLFTLPITIPTIFHLLAMQILGQCDVLMINEMLTKYHVGIYSLSRSFSAVISIIYGALNNSWVPFYYDYTSKNQFKEIKKHANNYLKLFTILCMGFILLSNEVFKIFADSKYYDGIDAIPYFIVGYYMVFLYSFPVNYEFFHKRTKAIAVCTIITAIINVFFNYVFIKALGYLGAVYATAISHGIQFLIHYLYAKFRIKDKFPFASKMFIKGILWMAVTLVFWNCFKNNFILRWGSGFLLGIYLLIDINKRKTIF